MSRGAAKDLFSPLSGLVRSLRRVHDLQPWLHSVAPRLVYSPNLGFLCAKS
jgi:hypothetical protein